MEESPKPPVTALDRIADGNGLQVLKASIPYFPAGMQKIFSVYVKLLEVSNVAAWYSNPLRVCEAAEPAAPDEILNDIRAYCTDAQKKSLDQTVNLIHTFKLYQEMQRNG